MDNSYNIIIVLMYGKNNHKNNTQLINHNKSTIIKILKMKYSAYLIGKMMLMINFILKKQHNIYKKIKDYKRLKK